MKGLPSFDLSFDLIEKLLNLAEALAGRAIHFIHLTEGHLC
jgi:hypothetical protein